MRADSARDYAQNAVNVLLMNVSLLDGMASSARVRTLFEPLVLDRSVILSNLIYGNYRFGEPERLPFLKDVTCQVINLSISKPWSVISFLRGGFSFIRERKDLNRKNVLYFYDYPDIKSILFVVYAYVKGYKVVIDMIEDNDFFTQYISLVHRFRIGSSRWFLRLTPFFTQAYIGISDHIVNKLKKLTQKRPVYFIPVAVQMKWFESKAPFMAGKKSIFYGGSFAAKDGLAVLIEAFDKISRSHKDVHLVFSGRGQQHDLNAILNRVNELEHKNRVHFLGYLSTEQYYNVMNGCDIFCMTRNFSSYANAGFPFKLGEFLAAGKAIVSTRVGDVNKYLIHKKNALLIEPESVTELADALSFCLTNEERVLEMGETARQTAFENFDSEKLSRSLKDILTTL